MNPSTDVPRQSEAFDATNKVGTVPSSDVDPKEAARGEREESARINELTIQRDEFFDQISRHDVDAIAALHPCIRQAVQELGSFFAGYTNYFWTLDPEEMRGSDRSHEAVLNDVLEKLRGLWSQLSLAINQRFNPVYGEDLAKADETAREILQQVADVVQGLPILYFEKSFQISRHPYQTFPLLGIAQERFKYDGRASLAHELGHHVFWNNGDLDEYAKRLAAIRKKIAETLLGGSFPNVNFGNPVETQRDISSRFEQYSIWSGWIEEVFADVFGTLIAGPQFAKSAQDVLIRERVGQPGDLIMGDGDHPAPALRPLISLAVLREIAEPQDEFGIELTRLIGQFDARWQPLWEEGLAEEASLARQGQPSPLLGHTVGDNASVVTLSQLRERLESMVKLVLYDAPLAVRLADRKEPRSLKSAIGHWGKSRSTAEMTEIREMQAQLSTDQISTIASRIQLVRTANATRLQGKDDGLFDRFQTFVGERRDMWPSRPGRETKEWEALLDFNLTLEQGIHTTVCQEHAHKHKHWSSGAVKPC